MATNLTIGEVLPDDLKSNYPQSVLNVSVAEAFSIAEEGNPPTSNLSMADIEAIKDIFDVYYATGGGSEGGSEAGGSSYWNKSPDENSAYWQKQ